MQSGSRRKPTINPTSVEAALNTLVYTTTDTSSAATLYSLAIIEEILHDPARPLAKNLREFALKSILCSVIEATLIQYRTNSELKTPAPSDTLSIAIEQIQQDSQQNSADLLGWSFLYYRYVRVDMGISQETYSEFANIETRTLRRYKKHTISVLAEKLIDAEWEARRKQHQNRLLSTIPTDVYRPVIGREHQLKKAVHALNSNLASRCYLTGVSGIGKTAFISSLVHRLIAADNLDYVIWINLPRTIDDVLDAIRDTIMPPHSRLELRDVLITYATLIVLDDISMLAQDLKAFSDLLDFLAPAKLCFSSPRHLTLTHSVLQIHLEEFNREQVEIFVRTLDSDLAPVSIQTYSDSIWQQVGGNPLAVQLALMHLKEGRVVSMMPDTLAHLYQHVYANLSETQMRLWLLVAAMNDRQISVQVIEFFIAQNFFSKADISHLQNIFMLQTTPSRDSFFISQSAQQFIFLTVIDLSTFINTLLIALIKYVGELKNAEEELYKFCIQLLLNATLDLSSATITELMRIGWNANQYLHDLHQWLRLFIQHKDILESELDIKMAYAVCLRQTNALAESRHILQTLILETGHRGDFGLQAKVLLELAIWHRSQGQFQHAQEHLNRVQKILDRLPDAATYERLVTEFAQIEIERSKPTEALQWLKQLTAESSHTMILKAEIFLLLTRAKKCQEVAFRLLPLLKQKKDYVKLASLHTIVARSFDQQGQVEMAIDWFNGALSYAEQHHDKFAIARLKSNIAALLLRSNDIHSARILLRDAETIQHELNDKIGLDATRHNLQYLTRLSSKHP